MGQNDHRILVVGLTGGIGSGKSTVAQLFAARAVPVIDADVAAREVVAPGQPAVAAIAARFGQDVLTADGIIDRAKLRRIVFSDPPSRIALERLLHPLIRQRMDAEIKAQSVPYCIACIPLLLEANQVDFVDFIVIVDVPEDVQIQRVQLRDKVTETEVRAILRSQSTRAQRLDVADYVIHNDGNLRNLEHQVETMHRRFLAVASSTVRRPSTSP